MAANRIQNKLMAKLGKELVKAHEEHKDDETQFSQFSNLPAGIENGIAQLVDCKFDEYKDGDNKGKLYFYAAGTVVRPLEHDGIPIEGLRTQITEALCNTPNAMGKRKTISDHLGWIYNELRKLGIDTSNLDPNDLESVCEVLLETKPFFSFETWKGKKQTTGQYAGQEPKTNHRWNGLIKFDPTTDEGSGVDDQGEPEGDSEVAEDSSEVENEKETKPSVNGKVRTAVPPQSVKRTKAETGNAGSKKAPPSAKQAPAKAEPFNEFEDLDSLATAANNGDRKASKKLEAMALEAGFEQEAIDNADSWDAVVEMISSEKDKTEESTDSESGEGDDSEEAVDKLPEVDEVVLFCPLNPRTNKPSSKPVECKVLAVDSDESTVNLKSLVDNKTVYKRVPVTALQQTD